MSVLIVTETNVIFLDWGMWSGFKTYFCVLSSHEPTLIACERRDVTHAHLLNVISSLEVALVLCSVLPHSHHPKWTSGMTESAIGRRRGNVTETYTGGTFSRERSYAGRTLTARCATCVCAFLCVRHAVPFSSCGGMLYMDVDRNFIFFSLRRYMDICRSWLEARTLRNI